MIITHAHNFKDDTITLCGEEYGVHQGTLTLHICGECANKKIDCADCVDIIAQPAKIKSPTVNADKANLETALRISDELRKENARLKELNKISAERLSKSRIRRNIAEEKLAAVVEERDYYRGVIAELAAYIQNDYNK